MAKKKILIKRKFTSDKFPIVQLKNEKEFIEHDPLESLIDEGKLVEIIQECTHQNDPEGVLDAIQIYLNACARANKKPKKTYEQLLEHSSFVKKFVHLINEPVKTHA